jgi:hypothetical protein
MSTSLEIRLKKRPFGNRKIGSTFPANLADELFKRIGNIAWRPSLPRLMFIFVCISLENEEKQEA